MGKGIWDYVTLRPLLDPIISDRACSVHALLDVAGLENLPAFMCLASPYPRKAVSLQLHPHREPIPLGSTDPRLKLTYFL